MHDLRAARARAMDRYLAVWQGLAAVDTVDELMTSDYVGHLGSGARTMVELKRDITAYRASVDEVRFSVHHRFSEGDYVATRLSVQAIDSNGVALEAVGLNVTRWDGAQLAEEWAVWEPLHPVATP